MGLSPVEFYQLATALILKGQPYRKITNGSAVLFNLVYFYIWLILFVGNVVVIFGFILGINIYDNARNQRDYDYSV